jgi:hypothetical protein
LRHQKKLNYDIVDTDKTDRPDQATIGFFWLWRHSTTTAQLKAWEIERDVTAVVSKGTAWPLAKGSSPIDQ